MYGRNGEEKRIMASVEKFTDAAVTNQLRHNAREIITNSNKDIDKARTHLNYSLTPERSLSPRAYYTARKQELYVYGRKDVKTMAGWIVTAPKELTTPEEEHEFFISTYNFLENRYGKENVVLAVVHYDVLTRHELQCFHSDLQKHLQNDGLNCSVITGITKLNGRNYTVKELKTNYEAQRKLQYEHEYERSRW